MFISSGACFIFTSPRPQRDYVSHSPPKNIDFKFRENQVKPNDKRYTMMSIPIRTTITDKRLSYLIDWIKEIIWTLARSKRDWIPKKWCFQMNEEKPQRNRTIHGRRLWASQSPIKAFLIRFTIKHIYNSISSPRPLQSWPALTCIFRFEIDRKPSEIEW